jgi:translation initiation factor IF-2
LVPDDWDGDTIVVPVSAKLQQGLEDLMEAILLVADNTVILANPEGQVFGSVIEAERDRAKGVVATLLVQNGTVKLGDILVAGTSYGRVKAMFDFRGNRIEEAGPSTPVSVMGFNEVPKAGDLFRVAESDKDARVIVSEREENKKQSATSDKVTLESIFERYQAGQARELRLVIKADVQGSVEPIVSSLQGISASDDAGEIKVNVIHSGTGNISENDVMLASTTDAIVLGFNVTTDGGATSLADVEGVDVRLYDIIYRLTEDVEKALKGMLQPEEKETIIGKAEVRAVFKIRKTGNIAGCRVTSGEIRRKGRIRVMRGDELLHEDEISSLKHERDDVREVREGFECGIGVKGFDDFKEGDILECYITELVARG